MTQTRRLRRNCCQSLHRTWFHSKSPSLMAPRLRNRALNFSIAGPTFLATTFSTAGRPTQRTIPLINMSSKWRTWWMNLFSCNRTLYLVWNLLFLCQILLFISRIFFLFGSLQKFSLVEGEHQSFNLGGTHFTG